MTTLLDCYRHAGVAGTNTCGVCLKPICDACLHWANLEPACASCARKKRNRTGIRQTVVVGIVLFLGCTGVATAMLLYKKPFDYGEHSGTVIVLKKELDLSPCDRAAIVKLGETMAQAGDHAGALARSNAWLERCGEYERLRWVTYSVYRDTRDEAGAIREATRLIDLDPDDKDYWWWRGVIYERNGELRKAAADYEKSLEIQPRLSAIPFNLADVYERMGKPCDAARPLEEWAGHHPGSADARTTHRIARLRAACGDAAPAGDGTSALAATGTGRVDLNGATIRLPDGFAALPPGWSDVLDPTATLRDAKGFVRVNAIGDTVVIFRAIDVETRTSAAKITAELERIGRTAGGKVVRSQSKAGSRSVEVGLSFNRERNAGEWRGLAGHLEGSTLVRMWLVQCEDRPATKSEDCQEIVRSLAVPDLGTLRLFSDVYATE